MRKSPKSVELTNSTLFAKSVELVNSTLLEKMLWFHWFFKAYSVFIKSVELTNSICFAKVWNWSIPHFWRKSCGYVVKSHQLDWNAIPIRFKKLDWKIHNSSLEWKQSNTRPSASCRIGLLSWIVIYFPIQLFELDGITTVYYYINNDSSRPFS